jgi:RHS repeat-associated protein
MTNPLGYQTSYAYNAAGLLTSTTDADGRTITYGYDAIGEKTSETWVGGNYTATYQYNGAGQLTEASDPFSTYTYTYDADGRETSVSNAGTPNVPAVTLTYTYDNYGNRTSLSDSLGAEISYAYDNDQRMVMLGLYMTSNHSLTLDATVAPSYNAGSLVTGLSLTATGGNAITSSMGYDKANELTNITDTVGSTTLANYTYGYNAASQLTSYQDNNSSSLTYGYDANGELTSATGTLNGSNYSVSYSYDANGNRNMTGYTTGTGNELTSDGTYNYTYDNDGNTLTQTNIATGSVTYYTWDYRNRLTEVKQETSTGTVLNDEKFTYDVNNNRIAVSLNGTTQLYTVYDGANPYMDFNGSGTLTERYLTNPKALSQFYGQVNASGTVQWFLTDNINSIRQVISASGSSLDAITYDPYGNILNQTNAAYSPRFMYTGGAYDSITSDYQFNARYYNPGAGRFVTQDPASFTAGDMDLYAYTFNHPTSVSDPSGLDWSWGGAWGGAAGGGAYGAGVGAIVGTFIFPGVGTLGGAVIGGLLGSSVGFVGGGLGTQPIANWYLGAEVSLTFAEQFAFGMTFVGAPVGTVAGFLGPAAYSVGSALLSYMYRRTVGSGPVNNVIQFGSNPNQNYHTFRHVVAAGMDSGQVEAAVQADLTANLGAISPGLNVRTITVGGQQITYTAFKLPNGVINVGRITLP